MTKRQREFIKALCATDHSEAPYRSFEMFCEMAYCALAKPLSPPDRAEALEAQYMRVVGHLKPGRADTFAEMLALATCDLQETGDDFLGTIMMDDAVRAHNRDAGQFFTPMHVLRLMAALTIGDLKQQLEEKPFITVCEPTSGAGGMLLAFAQEARKQGVDLPTQLWFDATDISSLCFHLTFIQMALAGLAGVARQDDTLCPRENPETALTPVSWRFLGRHGWPHLKPVEEELVAIAEQVNADPPPVADVPFALEYEVARSTAVQERLFP